MIFMRALSTNYEIKFAFRNTECGYCARGKFAIKLYLDDAKIAQKIPSVQADLYFL